MAECSCVQVPVCVCVCVYVCVCVCARACALRIVSTGKNTFHFHYMDITWKVCLSLNRIGRPFWVRIYFCATHSAAQSVCMCVCVHTCICVCACMYICDSVCGQISGIWYEMAHTVDAMFPMQKAIIVYRALPGNQMAMYLTAME